MRYNSVILYFKSEDQSYSDNEGENLTASRKPRNFSWLIEGVLAGSNKPSEGEIKWLHNNKGIRAIISLTEEGFSSQILTELNLKYLHAPVADFSAPTLEMLIKTTDFIAEMRNRNKPVLVHCTTGIGRTGTILAAYLIRKGKTFEEAIKEVRHKRPGSVETNRQEAILQEFEILKK